MKRISLGLPEELLALVDEKRGDVPRERYLRGLITFCLLDDPSSPARTTPRPDIEARLQAAGSLVAMTAGAHTANHGADHGHVGLGKRCARCGGVRADHPA